MKSFIASGVLSFVAFLCMSGDTKESQIVYQDIPEIPKILSNQEIIESTPLYFDVTKLENDLDKKLNDSAKNLNRHTSEKWSLE